MSSIAWSALPFVQQKEWIEAVSTVWIGIGKCGGAFLQIFANIFFETF